MRGGSTKRQHGVLKSTKALSEWSFQCGGQHKRSDDDDDEDDDDDDDDDDSHDGDGANS